MSQFSFTPAALEDVGQRVLRFARDLGTAQAMVEVSESCGLSISVRKSEQESVEHNRDKGVGVSVFLGKPGQFSHGNASTADFSDASLKTTVQAAYDIARFTAIDDCSGLPNHKDLFQGTAPDLDLFHPWNVSTAGATALALQAEAAAFDVSPNIRNSDGCSVSASQGQFYQATQYGNDLGFCAGYPYSRHSLSVSPIAEIGKGARRQMQRDHWYTSDRNPALMATPAAVGHYAAQRTLARLNARKIPTGQYPVLFEAPLASGLLGALVQAASGGALYRDASFLKGSLGKAVANAHIDVHEDPTLRGAIGSAAFDDEGTPTVKREIVTGGVLNTYFLSTYSARKLGMRSTGHAGGSHNLRMTHRATRPSDDFAAMLRQLGTGLLVTEMLGQGVNYISGDYSRGAAGFWVEHGVIVHAVEEITIAGNMKQMLMSMVAIGADELVRGTKTTGSVLIERMSVAGV